MSYLKIYECAGFREASGFPVCYIEDTPENIAAFIVTRHCSKNYAFVSPDDELKLFSMGKFLDLVEDQKYLHEELLPVIVGMQTGERDIPEVKYLTEGQATGSAGMTQVIQ